MTGGYSDYASDQTGESVDGVGDVNGDGTDDVAVGAHGNDAAGENAGAVYVVLGPFEGEHVLDEHADGKLLGGEADEVAGAGDTDGDGLHDLIVGAPYSPLGETDAGAVYVVFGSVFAW